MGKYPEITLSFSPSIQQYVDTHDRLDPSAIEFVFPIIAQVLAAELVVRPQRMVPYVKIVMC